MRVTRLPAAASSRAALYVLTKQARDLYFLNLVELQSIDRLQNREARFAKQFIVLAILSPALELVKMLGYPSRSDNAEFVLGEEWPLAATVERWTDAGYRRRKIRCDGDRPVCRQCRLRPPRSLVPCKYSHTPPSSTVSPQFEDMVEEMQHRIAQLEASSGADLSRVFLSDPYPPGLCRFVPPSPPDATRELLDGFLHRFSPSHLFFLDVSDLCLGSVSPGLLHTMYLWASRLSLKSTSEPGLSEADLLTLAVDYLARRRGYPATSAPAMDPAHPPSRGGPPLAPLPGRRARGGGKIPLRRRDFPRLHRAPSPGATGVRATHFPPTLRVVRRGAPGPTGFFQRKEQIDAFWSIVILNNYWVAASSLPSSIPCDTSIGTPWPSSSTPPEFRTLDQRLEFFRARLAPAPPTDTRVLVTHTLVNVALIRLHSYGPNCLSAAGCVVAQLQNTPLF
ncbi:hypothetical protein B0H17DRAFT_1183882 [Mycena rosella]|uniref:Uncharacterized protein n=1 Tax=Mycena rosella TaxID=1033263 RepID=A0AAD7CZ54_MYCRO|nr:hypothetical protein B0H17DRAFT_1183882 [Mycena rosella]